MTVTRKPFGSTDGATVELFTISNSRGMVATVTNYGATLVSVITPDRDGNKADVVLGYEDLAGFLTDKAHFGSVIGRHANRLEDAKFEINGVEYSLNANDGKNQLHGGLKGFDKMVWQPEVIDDNSVAFSYLSPDGEENYPGNLQVKVTYTLTEDNGLRLDYAARSDKDTVVNLTNHVYFNLSGHDAGSVQNHQLMLNAKQFTPANGECLPTGEISDVKGTFMDFTSPRPIGAGLTSDEPQITQFGGYDHNWILDTAGDLGQKAAEVYDPQSGRVMAVYTTKPGIQFYTGNFLDGALVGKGNTAYPKWSGLCLETQYYPNSMKHKHFPSPVLKAGEEYQHTTIYEFSTK